MKGAHSEKDQMQTVIVRTATVHICIQHLGFHYIWKVKEDQRKDGRTSKKQLRCLDQVHDTQHLTIFPPTQVDL